MTTPAKATKNLKFQTLLLEEKDGIAVVTFNRPEVLNAINRKMMEELNQVIDLCSKDLTTRVLILTGAGEKAFVAGADISQFPHMSEKDALKFAKFGQNVFLKLENLKQPVIAAVNGYALGGGCELALSCDFILASTQAKFGQPEVNLGILPGYGGTQRLSRLVGKAMAKELIFSGKIISAEEALRIRLVNRVFEPQHLMEEVLKLAHLISSKAPLAVAESKAAIEKGYYLSLSQALEIEGQAFAKTFGTEDQKEGARAFLEKRPPKFVGK